MGEKGADAPFLFCFFLVTFDLTYRGEFRKPKNIIYILVPKDEMSNMQ